MRTFGIKDSEFMETIPRLNSIKQIEKQYSTGDLPVLVVCSDKEAYICKYMPSSNRAYKLVCELIGSQMAEAWRIKSPTTAFIRIEPAHWAEIHTPHNLTAPTWGYKKLNNVVDITPTTCNVVERTQSMILQLLKIALFDFWIANEDRTYNNANLLYDIEGEFLISIDYGGIFNTSTFDYPLSQLTMTDTILYADLFRHLVKEQDNDAVLSLGNSLKKDYDRCIENCRQKIPSILSAIPDEWNISQGIVETKLNQLVDEVWTEAVWSNFIECLNDNLEEER